jgi:competence protein ComEA
MFNLKFITKLVITTLAALLVSLQARSFADSTAASKGYSAQSSAIDTTTDVTKRKASGETAGVGDATAAASRSRAARVDLNTADRITLESLPGVGPATASAIIAARPFKSVAELKRVDGIGDVRFAELKNRVMVSHDRSSASGSPAGTSSGSANVKSSAHDTTGARSSARVKSINGKVNINTASKEELDALPGIGPVKAQAIVGARPFNAPEDIKNVRGIKDGEYAKIRDMITVK